MKPGDILRGEYELVSSIGRGGMGEVFHAVHLPSQTNVAIKVVSRAFIGDLLMARLEREAAAAARIKSDFIPQVLAVDRTETGELFLVMELLQGESLSERMKKNNGLLSWDEVREIGDNVLRALCDAHAAGVVHRDLKPGNIFIEYLPNNLGRARILDFGVCKLDVHDGEKLTITGESVGTIAYMAPEQIRGASRVDERADLYSFAMVIFEALSGRLAYDASGQMALLACKLEKEARSLKSVAQVPIPPELDALIGKCLSREPDGRFPNAKKMLEAWRALGPATQQPLGMPIVSSGSIHNPATQTVLTAGTIQGPPPKSRAPFLAVGLGAVALGIGAIVVLATVAHHRSHSASAQQAENDGVTVTATSEGAAAAGSDTSAAATATEGAAPGDGTGSGTPPPAPPGTTVQIGVVSGSGVGAAAVTAGDPVADPTPPAPPPPAVTAPPVSPPTSVAVSTPRSSGRSSSRSTQRNASPPTPAPRHASAPTAAQPTIITDPKY